METQMQLTMGLAVVNIVLLLVIMQMEVESYRKMRAEYTLFVIIFVGMFLLQYLAGAYMYLTNMEIYSPDISIHVLILTGIQTTAFGYLLYMLRQ